MHLEDYDKGDSSWSYYLGYGSGSPETHWLYATEGLWGEFDTVDFCSFNVIGGTYTITIWAEPVYYSYLDVELKIFNSNMQLMRTENSRGVGGREDWTFQGTGVYYFMVIKVGTGWQDTHAGAYLLKVDIVS